MTHQGDGDLPRYAAIGERLTEEFEGVHQSDTVERCVSAARHGADEVCGGASPDLVRHVATVRGVPVNLTRSEFQLLRLLVGRPGEVFERSQIMEELWQTEFDGDERACDVHISNLRQKVERDPQKPELVLTVRGVGYKFDGASA